MISLPCARRSGCSTRSSLLAIKARTSAPFGKRPKFPTPFASEYRRPIKPLVTMDSQLQDLLQKLLVYAPEQRLGFNGAREVRAHPYWHQPADERDSGGILRFSESGPRPPDWERIEQARLPSPLRCLVSEAGRAKDSVVERRKSEDHAPNSARSVHSTSEIPGMGSDEPFNRAKTSEMAEAAVAAEAEEVGEEEKARRKSALDVAQFMARSETADEARAEHGNFEQGRYLEGWEFVSPQAIAQEYVEQMSSCVSAV